MLIQFIKTITMYITIGYALVLFASFILNYHIYEAAINYNYEKRAHTPKTVRFDDLKDLVTLTNESYFKEVLDTILVPRVVGTPSHEKVKEFIGSELASLGYETEYDEFEDITPRFGKLKFTNVIGRLDPQASRFLALACHYDSKYFDEFNFLGATDSAVPVSDIAPPGQIKETEISSWQRKGVGRLISDVPIVHVIPARFPSVWHTPKDDYSALDFPTIFTLNKILQVFVYSYIFGDLRDSR